MALLRIEFRGTQTVVSLRDRETTVGRSNVCTIHLPDPALGEIHFRIQLKSRGYRLKDDGSGSGTFVNGKPVFGTTLEHGDVIEAASLRCTFLETADLPATATSEAVVRAPRRPAAPAHARARARGDPTPALVVGALVLIVLVAAAFLLTRGSSEEEAGALWRQAQDLIEAAREDTQGAETHLTEAVRLLETIEREHSEARVAGMAGVTRREAEEVVGALEEVSEEGPRVERVSDEAGELDAFARLGRLRRTAHPAVIARIESLEARLKERREERLEAVFEMTDARSQTLLAERRFAEAAQTWTDLEISDYFLRKRAAAVLERIRKKTSEEYRKLLRLAMRSEEMDARIEMLEASRPVFSGTRHADDLEVRISALKARRAHRDIVVLRGKKPRKDETKKDDPQVEEVPEGPYEDPPKVASLLQERRYAEAASVLHSITRHPDAKVRVEELTLLANLMADLVGAVQERPGEFTKVLLPGGVGRGDASGADARFLKIRREGKETRFPWSDLPAKSFVRLFRQAGFHKPPRLGMAIFFDEEELPKDAQQAYVAFFKSEQAPTTLTRVLARRRGIEPPAGGFVLFRGQIVSPSEQAAILLGEKIEKLARQGRSSDDRRRLSAWAELEKLGTPALETLTRVIRERRTQLGDELKGSRAFTPTRFAARFGKELEKRRAEARKFIADATKYPYPNKTKASQDQAEALVDRVRDLFETPFDDLLGASESAQALAKEIEALDTRLAGLDPLAAPMLEMVVEEITKKLDMRRVAVDERDRKRIEFNLAVEKYNEGLKVTTADVQERLNVRAVNEYRWMMGLHALKIDERLVRAARKHSIEMQQLNYFAHDSPTKHLKTPGHRAKRDGYGGGVSENIARGPSTGRQAFEQWFKSSGHHRNMLIPSHTEMGCGAAAHHWWTQLFGRLTGKGLSTPSVPPDPDPPGTSGNGMPPPGGRG